MTVHVHKSFDWQGAHAALCNATGVLNVEVGELQVRRGKIISDLRNDEAIDRNRLHARADDLHAINVRLALLREINRHLDAAHEALEGMRPADDEPVNTAINTDDCPF
jgi:hypothetical protein